MKAGIVLALVVTLGSLGVALYPLPSEAIGQCGPYRYTSAEWGIGATCAEAESNAIALARTKITCDSGITCIEIEEEVTPCYYAGNFEFHADWRIKYRCQAN